MPTTAPLSDLRVHVKLRLAALWTSLMFCFVYGDYFELYHPDKLASITAGRIGPFEVTQGVLVGTTTLMIIPSLMGALTVLLPATVSRAANIVFGLAYAGVMLLAIQGTWRFYMMIGLVEIGLCAAIVLSAWRWPRVEGRGAGGPAERDPAGDVA